MKINYQQKLYDLVASLDYTPKLLLHSCCGPCSTTCIAYLTKYFNITVLFYNPNIEPVSEYEKRKKEQIKFIQNFPAQHKLSIRDCDYDNATFKKQVEPYTQAKEGGVRCHQCYELRLRKTAQIAKAEAYDYFATTLTISPYKNSQVINEIGGRVGEEEDIPFLYSDFKKNDGYKQSIELSQKYDLYRQNYCGCQYGQNLALNNIKNSNFNENVI